MQYLTTLTILKQLTNILILSEIKIDINYYKKSDLDC